MKQLSPQAEYVLELLCDEEGTRAADLKELVPAAPGYLTVLEQRGAAYQGDGGLWYRLRPPPDRSLTFHALRRREIARIKDGWARLRVVA